MGKLKVAMIGCGGIRAQHMSGIFDEAPEIDVAAACDINRQALDNFQERYGVKNGFQDYRELFKAGGIDAVSIAVIPEELKVQIAVEALEHGFHVLAEKPMALTVKEAEAMAAAARKADRVLQTGFQRRFEPVYRKAWEVINDTGSFGDVAFMRVSFIMPTNYTYVAFMSQSPHTFDAIQYFGGYVKSVRSLARREFDHELHAEMKAKLDRPSEQAACDVEPGLVALDAVSLLEFESGAVGTLTIANHGPGAQLRADRFEIIGTKNRAVIIDDLDNMTVLNPDGTREVVTTSSWCRKPSAYGFEYKHFAEWIETGKPSVINLEDALRSVYLYEGFIRSLHTDEPVLMADLEED